jgi:hypothetical protein
LLFNDQTEEINASRPIGAKIFIPNIAHDSQSIPYVLPLQTVDSDQNDRANNDIEISNSNHIKYFNKRRSYEYT